MFVANRLAIAFPILALMTAPDAAAQPVTQLKTVGTSGDITGNGGAVTMTGAAGMASLLIQTVGTFSLTWELQCAGDGVTFDADDEIPVTLIAATPAAADAVTSNAEALYTATIAGCRAVRVIATAFTSGTMSVTMTATPTGGSSSGGGGASGSVSISQGGNTAAVNASSQLSVTCANCSGTGVSVNEDVASADGQAGTPAYTVRNSTLTGATSLDGDYQPMKSTNAGAIYTAPTYGDTIAAVNNGSTTAQTPRFTLSNDSTGTIATVSTVTTLNGTASLTPGVAAANLGKAEDAVHASGDTGVLALAVRRDANTSLVDATNDNAPLQVDATGSLKVAIISGAGSGGTAIADNATFTPNTTSFTPIGGEVDDTGTTAATENSAGAARMTVQRGLHVNLRTAAGVEITPATDVVEDAAETPGGTGPQVMSVRRDVLASSAGTTGDNATINTTATGALWVAQPDPCSSGTKIYVNISQTTGTQLWTGTASNRSYICSINLVTATAQNIALVGGTGTVCATGISGLMGGSTAATGWNFAANGGIVVVGGNAAIAKSAVNADNVCLLTSSTGQISGNVSYVVAP